MNDMTDNEEKLLPLVRARLAERLFRMGFKAKEISGVLRVTPAAVTQYLKGRRGNKPSGVRKHEQIIDALADRAAHRIRSSSGPLEIVELLDAGYQLLSAANSERILENKAEKTDNSESIRILKGRLQLELKAAEKCLDLANRTRDDYSKLLLRMVASDSIRHADIVSQLMSWLETGHEPAFEPPDEGLLSQMLTIEDSTSELSLSKTVRISHGFAKLLLESIDMDEKKHDRLIAKMIRASKR